MSEDTLTKKFIDGQLKTLEREIRRHDAMLVSWLTNKLGGRDVAMDIAQDVYLRVWRYAHKSRIENPQALLFKTAANLAANEFRARQRHRANYVSNTRNDESEAVDNVPSQLPTPEEASCVRSDVALSFSTIEGLPDKIKRAFVMSRFQEMSYDEIASALNVSVSSVEKYMITALKALRKAVGDDTQTTQNVVVFPKQKTKRAQ